MDQPVVTLPHNRAGVRRRFVQVVWMCAVLCLIGVLLSGPRSSVLLGLAIVGLSVVIWYLHRQQFEHAIQVFLWTFTLVICGLLLVNNAIYEPVQMALPVVLLYAGLFGQQQTYFRLLAFMLLFVLALCSAILLGYLPQTDLPLQWTSVATSVLILLGTGFTVRIISTDFRRLLQSLAAENLQVRASQQRLTEMAQRDALTGLYARSYAAELFEQAVERHPLAVVLLDLDHFKPINDALGHCTGDTVLQQVANRFRQLLGPDDFACRFGGDEFVLVLQADTVPIDRLQQLLALCGADVMANDFPLRLSGSVGVSLAPQHGSDFAELCRKADLAMYRAKAEGRNRWSCYDDSLEQQQHLMLQLITLLRSALKQQQISVVYQPKFQLEPFMLTGVEALMRWSCPELGQVQPSRFIPIAEETGLIDELGLFVLQTACLQAQQWQQQGWPVPVAVNVSGKQLRSGRLPAQVQQALADSGLPAHLLQLELTESTIIGDQQHIETQLQQIQALGVSLAIDDFGTGYANLQYLSRFHAGTLKIDQSFVRHLPERPRDAALVRGIIQLAESLQLTTVAEGVEDEASLALLRQLGCGQGQGYLWSRPLAAAELVLSLRQQQWPLAVFNQNEKAVINNSTPSGQQGNR
jgi:diguanylate cyclase (GGDEF)-like protein